MRACPDPGHAVGAICQAIGNHSRRTRGLGRAGFQSLDRRAGVAMVEGQARTPPQGQLGHLRSIVSHPGSAPEPAASASPRSLVPTCSD